MKIEFSDYKAASVFIDRMSESYGKEVEIFGQNYLLRQMSVTQISHHYVTVDLHLSHLPKRVNPEWSFGEDYLKDLRQHNSSLLKFTEKAIALFVSSGDAEKYLAKYNSDGTVR